MSLKLKIIVTVDCENPTADNDENTLRHIRNMISDAVSQVTNIKPKLEDLPS